MVSARISSRSPIREDAIAAQSTSIVDKKILVYANFSRQLSLSLRRLVLRVPTAPCSSPPFSDIPELQKLLTPTHRKKELLLFTFAVRFHLDLRPCRSSSHPTFVYHNIGLTHTLVWLALLSIWRTTNTPSIPRWLLFTLCDCLQHFEAWNSV